MPTTATASGLTLQQLAALHAVSLDNVLRDIPDALLPYYARALGAERFRTGRRAALLLTAHEMACQAETRAEAARAAGNQVEARQWKREVRTLLRHVKRLLATS